MIICNYYKVIYNKRIGITRDPRNNCIILRNLIFYHLFFKNNNLNDDDEKEKDINR